MAAAYGGLIEFLANIIHLNLKIKINKNLKLLEDNLILIYTSMNRNAHDIASSYVKNLKNYKVH